MCAMLAGKYRPDEFPVESWNSLWLEGAPGDMVRSWAVQSVLRMSRDILSDFDKIIYDEALGFAKFWDQRVKPFPKQAVYDNLENIGTMVNESQQNDNPAPVAGVFKLHLVRNEEKE